MLSDHSWSLEKPVFIPPKGTEFHCTRCCEKGLPHVWRSITAGMPIRCSRVGCQSPYYYVFKKGTSMNSISTHGCLKCAEMWNLLKPEHLIPQPTMNQMRQNWDNMLNTLYTKFFDEYKAAKKPLSRIPFSSFREVEGSVSSLLLKYELQYIGGKLIDSPEKPIVTMP